MTFNSKVLAQEGWYISSGVQIGIDSKGNPFDALFFSTIDGVDYTVTYFNDIYFQYEISGQNMTLIAGETLVVFQKK